MLEIPDRIVIFLNHSHKAITNVMKSAEIMEALAEFNFDKERMEEGKALHKKADTLSHTRRNTWVKYQTDGSRLEQYWKEVKDVYNTDIKLARIAFRYDKGILDTLEARGARKAAIAAWLKQAMVFYANALASGEIVESLSRFGLNRAKLKEHEKLMKGLEPKIAAKEALKGEARTATKDRDKRLQELTDWMKDLKTVIFIAFKDSQVPEQLGWLVKSEGYKPVGRPKKKKPEEPQEPQEEPEEESSPVAETGEETGEVDAKQK
jgi:hypothetical protein